MDFGGSHEMVKLQHVAGVQGLNATKEQKKSKKHKKTHRVYPNTYLPSFSAKKCKQQGISHFH